MCLNSCPDFNLKTLNWKNNEIYEYSIVQEEEYSNILKTI